MIEPRTPKYHWGQRVVTTAALYNDGSYPEREAEALLVADGQAGEIVQVGMHVETDCPVYLVEFIADDSAAAMRPSTLVIGCLEEELAPWAPPV